MKSLTWMLQCVKNFMESITGRILVLQLDLGLFQKTKIKNFYFSSQSNLSVEICKIYQFGNGDLPGGISSPTLYCSHGEFFERLETSKINFFE